MNTALRGSLELIREQEAEVLISTYDRIPVLIERGEGMHVYDSDGREYVDFLSGIGVNALGYNHPRIRAAIVAQAERLIHVSNLFLSLIHISEPTRQAEISYA